jgi:hypothetical protein
MQGLPQAPKGPLVILVEGFHSPCTACIRLVEWRDRKSINFDHTTNPSISLALRARMSEGRSEQGLPQAPGPLVKLLVEDSIALRHAFVWSWRDRKSIVTLLTRTTNPSISLALRAPHVRGPVRCKGPPAPRAL